MGDRGNLLGASLCQNGITIPSSVCWSEQGILIGQAAENAKAKNLHNYRSEFKRELGSATPYLLGNSSFLPEELIAEVLKKLKAEADKVVQGRGESTLTAAILTIPATYQPYKRNLMREAGEKAGFQQIELLEEPVAAAEFATTATREKIGSAPVNLSGSSVLVMLNQQFLRQEQETGNSYQFSRFL